MSKRNSERFTIFLSKKSWDKFVEVVELEGQEIPSLKAILNTPAPWERRQ